MRIKVLCFIALLLVGLENLLLAQQCFHRHSEFLYGESYIKIYKDSTVIYKYGDSLYIRKSIYGDDYVRFRVDTSNLVPPLRLLNVCLEGNIMLIVWQYGVESYCIDENGKVKRIATVFDTWLDPKYERQYFSIVEYSRSLIVFYMRDRLYLLNVDSSGIQIRDSIALSKYPDILSCSETTIYSFNIRSKHVYSFSITNQSNLSKKDDKNIIYPAFDPLTAIIENGYLYLSSRYQVVSYKEDSYEFLQIGLYEGELILDCFILDDGVAIVTLGGWIMYLNRDLELKCTSKGLTQSLVTNACAFKNIVALCSSADFIQFFSINDEVNYAEYTGIDNEKTIGVFPNPSRPGRLNYHSALETEVEVYNINGRLYDRFLVNENEIGSFTTEHYNEGVYYILFNKNKIKSIIKFVVLERHKL
jgi:hypothetical protein